MNGRIRILPNVLHIPILAKKLFFINKMNNVGEKTMFGKEIYRIIQGAMVLIRGVHNGTLYKLL